ncbi:50S ribosomal protein L29 [Lawsonia intracellularis]|uniref:50S ribosomal protein L29 n=1 Tax=Lawsonia intracellularis TaxID=29546 RepID=UPI00155AFBEB|nr:50S ribosomal protein L29 [Lawsonia intracellularis]MBZ3892843.1 50S ribosomal protein L29 [Lawsonia intracellularis]UYH52705.1 50S ribosomal protein L29 [Lawsonia intracellularis]
MDEASLKLKLAEKREELFKLRFQHAAGQLEKTSSLLVLRRDIARILTILKEKV